MRLCQSLLCVPLLLAGASRARAADAPRPPRVLIVNSFGSRAPPFTTHSTAFETTLTREIGTQVDLDEVSLDVARFAQPDMEDAFADLLRKRLSTWKPDLVVSFGSPAGRFVAQYRARLFPLTPVIYDGMDKSRLPADALDQNAAFVGSHFDLKGLIDDILQIKPDTDHVVVILGATPLERYWATAFAEAFKPFTPRVRFTFVNDLSFEQMLDLVSKLPPRSFVLLGMLLRDASGVTHNSSDALQRLNAVSTAPINGIYQHDLGLGIVGGRLYQGELEGIEGARVAIRILRGEPPSRFPPRVIEPAQPKYDWRELRRWGIGEDRLPPGSTILFRQPTLWERYRGWIAAGVAVIALQSGMIVSLVVQRRWRRIAELQRREQMDALRESEARFRSMADTAPVLIWMSGRDKQYTFFNKPWLGFTGRTLEEELGSGWAEGVHADDLARCLKTYEDAFDARRAFTMEYRLRRHDGEYRWIVDHGVPRHDAQQHFLGYIGTCVDVTDRKLAEADSQAKRAELAHLSRAAVAGELTATLAHELSQPLAAIRTNAAAVRCFLESAEPDLVEAGAALADISSDSKRASDVIGGLRNLLRRKPPEVVPVDLNGVVRTVERLLRSEAMTHRVEVRLDLTDDLPRTLGDEVQLQQVMLNLMMNAFAAMDKTAPQSRRVVVRTRLVNGAHVRAEVEDSGEGIAPDKLGTIFEPFVTTKASGLGMGLPICRSIVEGRGGRLEAANNLTGGATFSIALPASRG